MSLAVALEWKYGPVAGTITDPETGKAAITSWRHATLPKPTPAKIKALMSEYNSRPERKAEMIALLNERAEQERAKYITPGSGKALEYEAKRQEAKAIFANSNLVDSDYPFAAANATSTGRTLKQVATEWDAKAKAWAIVGAGIADKTETASKAIQALSSSTTFEDDADRIINAINWPEL